MLQESYRSSYWALPLEALPTAELRQQALRTALDWLIPLGELGDVNTDGTIDIVDALLVAQYYVGQDPQPFDPRLADVNCDSQIDIIDALLIAQKYVDVIDEFCVDAP